MRIIWVSLDGNDTTGDGSQQSPYRTIEKAQSEFQSGDQIRLMDGVHTPTDSIRVNGVEGSIFSENPQGASIKPAQTTLSTACISVNNSPRFSLVGLDVLQATDPSNNTDGILATDVENFLCKACRVSEFRAVCVADTHGIYAQGAGRIENCEVADFASTGPVTYGIRTVGIEVIDCEVASVSGIVDTKAISVMGVLEEVVWVGGTSVYIFDREAGTLTQIFSEANIRIDGVWPWAADDIWVAGYDTTGADTCTMHHYDGDSWMVADPPNDVPGALYCMWGAHKSAIWAGGYSGTVFTPPMIFVYDGVAWTQTSPPGLGGGGADNGRIFGIFGLSELDVWFVGSNLDFGHGIFNPVVYRWNGLSFSVVSVSVSYWFSDIWGTSEDAMWTTAYRTSDDTGCVYKYNGSTWINQGLSLPSMHGIHGFSDSDIWACGAEGTVVHWDGASWSSRDVPRSDVTLQSIWGSVTNRVYAVGQVISGGDEERYIYYWNGSAWTEFHYGTAEDLFFYEVSGIRPQLNPQPAPTPPVWIGGTSIYEWEDETLTQVYSQADLRIDGVWPWAADDIWAVGETLESEDYYQAMYHYDGVSWNTETPPTGTDGALFCMWGTNTNKMWAGGDRWFSEAPLVHEYDGVSWSTLTIPATGAGFTDTCSIWACFGHSETDVWFCGPDWNPGTKYPFVYRYNGSSFSAIDVSGIEYVFTGMWGNSSSLMWFTGATFNGPGNIYLLVNGSTWIRQFDVEFELPSMSGVYGFAFNDVWACGAEGTVVHWDGDSWEFRNVPRNDVNLLSIWGTSSNRMFAVGVVSPWGGDNSRYIYTWDGNTWTEFFEGVGSDFYLMSVSGVRNPVS